MSFEGFTPRQEKTAEEILKGSAIKDVGFGDEGFLKNSETAMEAIGGEYNPYAKKGGIGTYPEGERGERMISDEEAEEAGKQLRGTDAEKWELI